MEYTTKDAMFDIIPWQFPCTLVITLLFTMSWMDYRMLCASFQSLPAFARLMAIIHTTWAIVLLTVLALDLMVLPPMFALTRFACALWFAS